MSSPDDSHHPKMMSRRRYLRIMGAAAAASVLSTGCQGQSGAGQAEPAATTARAANTVPAATAAPAATSAPAAPAPTAAPQPAARVAIAQADTYDPALVRRQVRALIDNIGGLDDIVRNRPRVAIKVNLTGGTSSRPVPGATPIESFVTHPEVVRALGEAVREAGARELLIVEAVYEQASYTQWGYHDVARALGATLIDLNDPHPYGEFASVPVGKGWLMYERFSLNHLLQEVDTFISVAKLKCHQIAGVTLSMKNLFGLAPLQLYRRSPQDTYRSAFHGDAPETGARVPRIVLDLNRARLIHLALLDGIKTVEGGEGPWIAAMAPVAAGVLIAGKNPVATDAVAAAVMGFDPRGSRPNAPFLNGDNHIAMAADLGLGTNRLEEIAVVGARIDDVRQQFRPAI